MAWLKHLILILIGGYLGLLSWVIWVGAIGATWWYVGEVSAVVTSFVVGKFTTPLWVAGMGYESSQRWPLIGQIAEALKAWWDVHYRTIIGMAVATSGFIGIVWLCWPQ
ncbi:MAG: hypothetical protein HYR84_17115 [Planctomycetes bacterium]|nr:hypothetical protein [Planctomycetota bacterium]